MTRPAGGGWSEALTLGYQLHGSPAATFNGERVILAQALSWIGA